MGKVNGLMSTSAMGKVVNDVDNWLLNFDAVYDEEAFQNQYVILLLYLLLFSWVNYLSRLIQSRCFQIPLCVMILKPFS